MNSTKNTTKVRHSTHMVKKQKYIYIFIFESSKYVYNFKNPHPWLYIEKSTSMLGERKQVTNSSRVVGERKERRRRID
jgi:hypothetical protein